MKKPLQVMKFGGTSVGDARSIAQVIEIVQSAVRESDIAVVVSAMGGVTNRLIEAANQAKCGNASAVSETFAQLLKRHDEVVKALITSAAARNRLQTKLSELLVEGKRLCQQIIAARDLTPKMLDAVSGLGERFCAPLIATALSEAGVASVAIDATELIVTDSYNGGAEPRIDQTRVRCHARVMPLLREHIVPVVTGFIGATEEGVLTTLGRGGSDYSATILGEALDADEVIIWTDVTGMLTSDPRLVHEAGTVAEISYREAAELAHFGAKVLHPKTLRPVMQRGIPIWIRNTFAPDEPGTRIMPAGPRDAGEVTAITAIQDATLITIDGGSALSKGDAPVASGVLSRALAAAAAVRADVLLISESSSNSHVSLVIPSHSAKRTVEALVREFSREPGSEKTERSIGSTAVALVTLVGQNMSAASGTLDRSLVVLEEENLNIIAKAYGSSDCSLSFVMSQPDMETALVSLHRELALGGLLLGRQTTNDSAARVVASPHVFWKFRPDPATAD